MVNENNSYALHRNEVLRVLFVLLTLTQTVKNSMNHIVIYGDSVNFMHESEYDFFFLLFSCYRS